MFTRITALTALTFVLAACSIQRSDETTPASHNEADITFAQQMIPHHEQAIEMAELAKTRAESADVRQLAAQIEAAQDPEIATMTEWLESWDEHAGSEPGMGHGSGHGMPGMMTSDQMNELMDAQGMDFDRMFLTMMIAHHEGAIEMAKTEQSEGRSADAIALAKQIESAQAAEIATMRGWLDDGSHG